VPPPPLPIASVTFSLFHIGAAEPHGHVVMTTARNMGRVGSHGHGVRLFPFFLLVVAACAR